MQIVEKNFFGDIREKHKFQNQLDGYFYLEATLNKPISDKSPMINLISISGKRIYKYRDEANPDLL